MNVSEAKATNELLGWVLSLTLFETTAGTEGDPDVARAAGFLATRAAQAIPSSPTPRDVADQVAVLLGLEPNQPTPYLAPGFRNRQAHARASRIAAARKASVR